MEAFKKQLIEQEAVMYSNIAACYRQGSHSKKEIEYCSKVIERSPYLVKDPTMLSKAYLRRAYAYEHIENYVKSKEDLLRVKELQPSNQ